MGSPPSQSSEPTLALVGNCNKSSIGRIHYFACRLNCFRSLARSSSRFERTIANGSEQNETNRTETERNTEPVESRLAKAANGSGGGGVVVVVVELKEQHLFGN